MVAEESCGQSLATSGLHDLHQSPVHSDVVISSVHSEEGDQTGDILLRQGVKSRASASLHKAGLHELHSLSFQVQAGVGVRVGRVGALLLHKLQQLQLEAVLGAVSPPQGAGAQLGAAALNGLAAELGVRGLTAKDVWAAWEDRGNAVGVEMAAGVDMGIALPTIEAPSFPREDSCACREKEREG